MTAEPHDLHEPALRDRAVAAARGLAPFDLLLTGARVADVVTAELRAADVGVVGPLIASVHPPRTRHDAARTMELGGAVIAPGLIDTHVHIESSMMTPRSYAETVLPQGTTTICWDPHELGNVVGLDGVAWAIQAARDLPLRILVLAPSSVPSAPGLEQAGADFGPDELRRMLGWDAIHGTAELMDMRNVLNRTPRTRGIVQAALASGKLVCGHARDLAGPDLQAYAAAGISSDHEITSGADLLEKLRAGFTVELRVSHAHLLPEFARALRTLPHIPQTLTLCTDDIFPDDLVETGGLIRMVRALVSCGLDPLQALRAGTLNAAARIGRHDLGVVAPGRRADLVVLGDTRDFAVRHVFVSGREVASDGAMTTPLRADRGTAPRGTVKLAPFTAGDFCLRTAGTATEASLRTVHRPRFTSWGERIAPVRDGMVDLPAGLILMAVAHRHGGRDPRPVLGVLEGWSAWRGAIATTVSHDSHNLAVFGRDAHAMAIAANAVIAGDGGVAVAADGALRAVLPLPVAGLLSDAPPREVAAGFAAIRAAAEDIVDWKPPALVFKAVFGASLACNPGPHVTDLGITDGSTGDVITDCIRPVP